MIRRGRSRKRGYGLCVALTAPWGFGCQDLDRFDTSGDGAYCGEIVPAQFIRTTVAEGGFERTLRLRLELDTDALTTQPGTLWSDDAEDGPCRPSPTFDEAPLLTVPELFHDSMSTLLFDDSQEHNIVAWVRSECRGPVLAVVSLLRNDDVEVRFLKPPPETDGDQTGAFALFQLDRRADCGY